MDSVGKNCVAYLLFAVISLVAAWPAAAADPPPDRVTVAYCTDCVPFQFTNKTDGQPAGMIIDQWRLWSEKTGIAVDFRAAAWEDTLAMVRDGKADAHAGLFYNLARDVYLEYGAALTETDTHFFMHDSLPLVDDIKGLAPYKVGVLAGDYVEGYLNDRLPPGTVTPFKSYQDIMTALQNGALMSFAADTATALFHLQAAGLDTVFRHPLNAPIYSNEWFVATTEGRTAMIDLINDGMAKISKEEQREIEQSWLNTAASDDGAMVIAISRSYPPMTMIGLDGRPSGLLVDMWKLWSKTTGEPIRFRPSNWRATLESLKSKEADVHSGLFENKKRAEWMSFSQPIHEIKTAVYHRTGTDTSVTLSNMKGKKVGAITGSYQEGYLRDRFPEIVAIPYKDGTAMLIALIRGEIDALVHEIPTVEADINRFSLHGDVVRGDEVLFSNEVFAGVLKDNQDLLEQIKAGFAAIPYAELAALDARWLANPIDRFYHTDQIRVRLTSQEEAWLAEHKTIRLGVDPAYPPFEFIDDNGYYRGMAADYVALINDRLGIEIKVVPGLTWAQVDEGLKKSEIDVSPALTNTPSRRRYLNFTQPYISFPTAIVTRTDQAPAVNLKSFAGKKLALVKGYYYVDEIVRDYPEIEPFFVATPLEAMKAVSFGKADGLVENLATVSHLIAEHNISNLRLDAEADIQSKGLAIGVRQDWPVLVGILNKVLDNITQIEHRAIQNKWITIATKGESAVPKVVLTLQEQVWLADHPDISVGVMQSWPPFHIEDTAGARSGITMDVFDLVNERLGGRLHAVPGEWKQLLEDVKNGDVDALMDLTPTPKRVPFYNFTAPYLSIPHVFIARREGPKYQSGDDLAGKTVAIERGFGNVQHFQDNYPEVHILEVDDTQAALDAVTGGDADAYAGNRAVASYIMQRDFMVDLSVHGRINKSGSILAIGSRKDAPILNQILGKALGSISSKEMSVLIGAYVDAGTRDELTSGVVSIELSEDERIWLDNHNTVRVMVGSWPPFHFMEKGKPKGLALDYVRTILESHGVKTEFVPITWSDALAGISKLEDVDLLPTIARSVEREKLVNITQDYLSFPRVIFARTNDVYGSLEELHGKTVSVERGFITATLLKRDHPEINLMPVNATKDALEAVSFGKADAFVSNMAVGSFLIDRLGLINLGVTGQTEYKSDIQAMGVRKDWPELASIINKSLAAMSETQAHDMRAKWIASETLSGDGQDAALPPEIVRSEVAAGLWPMIAVAVLIFSALAFFIRLLLRSSKGDAVALQMGTKRFRFMIIAALLLLALAVSSVSWLAYNHNKNRIVEVAGINLQTVLSSTVERLKTWVTDEKKQIARAARDPQLVELTRSLLFLPKDKQPLQFSQALAKIRTYFRNQDLTQGSRGFFIISTDGITLASMRDNNLAGQNFIATQMPDLFERVVRGEAVFIPPIRSDVQLDPGTGLNALPPTMFFAAPIVDENGTVLAVLTNRIDPAGDFTAITQTGNMGNSGETYAFDQSGLMMSSSRFEDELVRRGLLEQGQPSILNIVLTSPAANDTATLTFMAQSAVSGRAGINLDGYDDYRGVKVLGAWQWVDELGLGLTTEIDAAEALDTVGTLRNTILAILGLTLTLSAGATMFTLALGERASSSLIRAKNELEDRVTERTQELQNSETRIHTIINNASDGIIVIGEKGIIQSFSPSAERIFGYVSDEVIGKNIKMLMPEPTRSEHDGYLERYLNGGEARIVGMNREVVGLRKDKTEFPMDLAVGGAVLDNEHIFTGMVRDITERKKYELDLKKNRNDLERMVVDLEQSRIQLEEQAAEMAALAEEQAALRDKAEEATRSKAAFLAAMSHEIRTPMNGVVGMISLLQETQLEHDQRNMMNTVQDSAFSLLQIINDILDFSKIEAGKMSVEKIPVNIDGVLESVTETLLPNVAKKKLRMALMIDPNIPDHVMTDQVRLRQILFNLAGNATKFTENSAERQGVISLTAEMVEPAKDGRIQICFSVIDNGIGMKPEAVNKLFTPFTQADQSTTRRFGGTGLGLSICKNLTELLGGQISVTSEEGKGSAFHVTLPFDIAEQADDRIAKHDLSGLNIAYAVKFDDSAEAIERYATAGGARVTRFSADEMVEGVRASAKSDPFDIVMLGAMVSDEDRDAMIHTLRDDKDVPGPRFVILTIDRSDLRGMVLPDTVVVEATPVRKSTFMHGIAMAAGRASPHVDSDVTKLSFDARNAPEIEEAREAGELILIAEDNLTNQDVIRRQLNVLGYACEVADDGMVGLEMLKSGRYGMLLTDCHMPNMDGYELTGSLRNLELDTDTRLPVVAITANALQGEAERCLAAGMDDYLAKPLEMSKLKAMLAKWLPVDHGKVAAPGDVPETAPAKEVPPHDGVVNVKTLTDMFGEDMGVVKEILGDYVQPSRDIIGEIDAGFEAHDADAVGKAGHKLKSSSRAIGADALADLCAALEQAGKGGDWGEIEKLYPNLHPTFDDVIEFIEAL